MLKNRRLMGWWVGVVALMTAALFVPLLWESDLLLRNGRTVMFVIALAGFFVGELLFGERGTRVVVQRKRGEPRPPARHRKP